MTAHEKAKALAKNVAEQMNGLDYAANSLGIKIVDVDRDFAKLEMKVQKDMLNGLAICHGGITFSLADTAFAYACNSENHKTVALNCQINFLAPAYENDLLTATAVVQKSGRTGVYDVKVTNQHDEIVALFRGTSHRTRDKVIENMD